MTIDFLLLILAFYLILFSIVGYGYQFASIGNLKSDIGFKGLIGIFILIIISIITNYFLPHNKIHNSLLLILGLFFFFQKFLKKDLKILLIVSSIFLITIFLSKNHDDFFYYHLPYELTLINYSKIVGLGQLGITGFNTQSSIFYLNSLFYLPVINLYVMHFGVIFIYLFSTVTILNFILKRIELKKIDILFYQYLLAITFFLIFFYRIAEHGTDRSGLLLSYILILLILESLFISKSVEFFQIFLKILIVLGLTISFKSFFIIYFSFLLFLIWVKKKYFLKIYKYIFSNIIFYLFFILCLLITLTTFLNSGCLIFPLVFTCFEFEWSTPTSYVEHVKDWFELWSKAGATPNYRVDNPAIYIQEFNWLSNWIKEYFFNKVSDFLISLTTISLFFIILFKIKKINNLKNEINSNKIAIYVLIFLIFLEWFFNHPTLRYGGYTIVGLLFFFPLSFVLETNKNKQKILRNSFFIIIFTFSIFFLRNIDRLYKEYNRYDYNLLENPYYKISEESFRVDKEIKNYINDGTLCKYGTIYVYKKNKLCG